tara:strand:+ start:344 stop:529 length:186 start_codon:yes stop_codon:yes gene_type:complete
MYLNHKENVNAKGIDERDKKVIPIQAIENHNYLYQYGHRMSHQIKWFKGSRNRGLKSEIAL